MPQRVVGAPDEHVEVVGAARDRARARHEPSAQRLPAAPAPAAPAAVPEGIVGPTDEDVEPARAAGDGGRLRLQPAPERLPSAPAAVTKAVPEAVVGAAAKDV